MANRERNKRSARQARQRERAAQEEMQGTRTSSEKKVVPAQAESSSRSKELAKGTKPGVLARVKTYFGSVITEMHRVVWPSRNELINYSVAVIVMLIVFGVLVWLVDTGFVALLVGFTGLRG